jgi:phosphoribosyl 1,2-cyclic phosphate phosphodiesterase
LAHAIKNLFYYLRGLIATMTIMTITITVLGTGTSQGIPVVACECEVCKSSDHHDKRLRTSVMIQTPHNILVVDAGPDFRQQMLRENVKQLDAILITHDHKDHIGGIDDIRAFNWVMQKPMHIYSNERSMETIRKDFSYAFEQNPYPGAPEIILHTIHNKPFTINGDTIIPIEAMHGLLPVFGFRTGNFSYLTDASAISWQELEKMKGSEIVIINGLRKQKHHSHFSIDEAIGIIQQIKPRQAYITHVSHQLGFHKEINAQLPNGIELAYDGLKIEIQAH